MNKCALCNKEFNARRADARYCGATCRQQAKRHVTDKSVTDNATDTVTDKKTYVDGKEVVGYGWRKEITFVGAQVQDVKITNDGEPMFYCGKHGEHVKSYCEGICKTCGHI